jgi:CO/xanthine dehydrogenase FAD-binding subunit
LNFQPGASIVLDKAAGSDKLSVKNGACIDPQIPAAGERRLAAGLTAIMKPAPFDYIRPDSLAEVCALLAVDEDARVIAGGQTLVPMLAMRLARPAKLIDILRLPELAGIREQAGAVIVGATTRQAQAERDPIIRASVPMLALVLPWVGHPPTRARGTIGGSVAHADPSAEIPLVTVTLGAEIMLATARGKTSLPANDFFIGPMETALRQGECISAIRFPVWPHRRVGACFAEVSARRSDFAFVAAAAQVALDDDGRCLDIALGVGGVGDRPLRLDMGSLVGTMLQSSEVIEAVNAAAADIDANSDLHASAAYRRRVAAVLCVRTLEQACRNASAKSAGSAR